jgi:hypothetical protein
MTGAGPSRRHTFGVVHVQRFRYSPTAAAAATNAAAQVEAKRLQVSGSSRQTLSTKPRTKEKADPATRSLERVVTNLTGARIP